MPNPLFGGWELGTILFLIALYAVGAAINPSFFGSTDALQALLRDASRFGVMAVGMTFVIVNKDLDLSVGSTVGLVAVVFSICFAPTYYDMGVVPSVLICLVLGLCIGLLNGFLVTVLQVPSFIGTLTMLFIGRGLVLGLTGGKTIGFTQKADQFAFFQIGATNGLGFNNQILIFLAVGIIGAVVLAHTRWGAETYAVGGNAQAAEYAGISPRNVRIRAYVISSLCATLAGLMNVAQDKTVTSQYGQGNELIVIAAVIVGGASILGGRGRVIGSCLGAILIVLIDKVLREGVPITRTQMIGDVEMSIRAFAQLPPGAVPAFLGAILLIAVLLEPYVIRRKLFQRLWARLRNRPEPVVPDIGGVAIEGAQTRGTRATANYGGRGLRGFLQRRDAAAILLVIALWAVGMFLRPDFWGNLDNSFNLLLAFSEIALLSVGLTFVIANGDIWSPEDYRQCRAESGCEHVMLGRSLLSRPDLALAIRADQAQTDYQPLNWLSISDLLLQFQRETVLSYPLQFCGNRLKQWLMYLQRHYPQAAHLFESIKKSRDPHFIENAIIAARPLAA